MTTTVSSSLSTSIFNIFQDSNRIWTLLSFASVQYTLDQFSIGSTCFYLSFISVRTQWAVRKVSVYILSKQPLPCPQVVLVGHLINTTQVTSSRPQQSNKAGAISPHRR